MNSPTTSGQRRRMCGAMEVHQRLLEEYPDFRKKQVDIERFMSRRMLFGETARRAGPSVIQVVVHVVYNKASDNISDEQVQSQIDVLNRDYQAKNDDLVQVPAVWKDRIGNTGIQFALATVDPDGKPTTGITRTHTRRKGFMTHDSVKFDKTGGKDAWPTDQYLNLWVCTLLGGLLGYAQFPGGPANTDGVVINNDAFGTMGTARPPFNLGRTAVHEVGHWFNLYHIWGDKTDCSGSDYVDDTPMQQEPNYGEPDFPHISCNNGPNGDMFMNYMDYVDDAAMHLFTQGQVERIAATLEGPRISLITPIEQAARLSGRKK